MKVRYLLISVIMLFVVGILVNPSYAKVNIKNIAGLWLFDEGKGVIAKDSSENKNDGSIKGCKWVKGQFGSALSFNGTSDRVIIPDADSLDLLGAWTITAWVFVNKTEVNYGHIAGKRDDATSNANYAFRINNVGTGWEAYFWRGAWQGSWGQGVVHKDVWSYMTATYDGKDVMTIYENGVKIGGGAGIGGPPPKGSAEVDIGGWQNNNSELLDGILDEVAILNVAIAENDINDIMTKGLEKFLGLTAVSPSGKLAAKWADIKKH